MFAVDPLPFPPLAGEVTVLKGSKAAVMKEIGIIEGAGMDNIPLAVSPTALCPKGSRGTALTNVTSLVTSNALFTLQVDAETSSRRVALTTMQQHVTVSYPVTSPIQPKAGESPAITAIGASNGTIVPEEDGEAATAGLRLHMGADGIPVNTQPITRTTQIVAQLAESCAEEGSGDRVVTAGASQSTASAFASSEQQWSVLPTPAVMGSMSASMVDDTVWGVTLQGLVYARVPTTDTVNGVPIEDDDEVEMEGHVDENGTPAPEGSEKISDAAPQVNNKTALTKRDRRNLFPKRMDESTSDDDDDDASADGTNSKSKKKVKIVVPYGINKKDYHAAWSLAASSEVDHDAYKLRGKHVPKNIVPHQLFRHVAAGSRECVWAITSDTEDAGRLVRREGFDPRDCIRSKKQPIIDYQHRVGEKWVDYSDDVVPMPPAFANLGGWFPIPVEDGGVTPSPTTHGTATTMNGTTAAIEEAPYATAWATHPANCPFLASDSRQYGNNLVDMLSRTNVHRVADDGVVDLDDVNISAMSNNNAAADNAVVNVTTNAAGEGTAPLMVSRLAQNPFTKTMLALKGRQFVSASVGKDGTLWAVTEEEVVTRLVVDDRAVAHPDDGVRRVWSRLWYREGSSLDSPGYRWVEATELFDGLDTLDPQDPFAVTAVAAARYAKDAGGTATVPNFRILSLSHIVQHELFAVIAVGEEEGEEEDTLLNDPMWTRDVATAYNPLRKGYLFQRIGITEANPTGTHWRRVVLESAADTSSSSSSNPLELTKIRSFALFPIPDDRHWAANAVDGAFETDPELYSRHPSFSAAIGAAVVVTADGRDVLDVTSAVKKHLATQEQSASFIVKAVTAGDADGSVHAVASKKRLVVGDLLPLPLVLTERARLAVEPAAMLPPTAAAGRDGALIATGENNGQLVVVGDDGGGDGTRAGGGGSTTLVVPYTSTMATTTVGADPTPYVVAAAPSNHLGVGLNRYDKAMRQLHPNVTDVFVDGALLSLGKQRALNPMSVRALDGLTTTASFGVEDEQKEAFSVKSTRGIRVPADLVEGLRGKLQLLRHRSSVPVADYLHGSLLSMAVTRDPRDHSSITHVVVTVTVDLNEEPETSDDEEDEDGEASLVEADGDGAAPQRRRTRAQFASLTVWLFKCPPSPIPATSRYAAAYGRLHVNRYMLQHAPPPSRATTVPPPYATDEERKKLIGIAFAGGIGANDCIGGFVHRITGCDLNGPTQLQRFQRATADATTLWRSGEEISSSASSALTAPIVQTVTTLGKRHMRAHVTIEFFNGQQDVPMNEKDAAAAIALLPAHGDDEDFRRTYATRQCRTTIAFHPSHIRVLGMKPAEVSAVHNAPAEDKQLTTITVTHRYGAALGHDAAKGASGGWQQGYADPKVVIAVPLPHQMALRDLAAAHFNLESVHGSLSDVFSAKYLQRLEGLRTLLSPMGSEPARATFYLSNGTNTIVTPLAASGGGSVAKNGALQLSAGAHLCFAVPTSTLPQGILEGAVAMGCVAPRQEALTVTCPLTLEAMSPHHAASPTVLPATKQGDARSAAALAGPKPHQYHCSAPTDCTPYLISAIGTRTTAYQSVLYGHCFLDPLRSTLPQPAPTEDSLWYSFAKADGSAFPSSSPSYVQIRDGAVFIYQNPLVGSSGNSTADALALNGKSIAQQPICAHIAATVEMVIGATADTGAAGEVSADAPLVSTASGRFTVSEVAPEGVRMTFEGQSSPSTVTAYARDGSAFPIAVVSRAVVTSQWVVARVNKDVPFVLTAVALSPAMGSGEDTHCASFLGLPCATKTAGTAPTLTFECVAADGSLKPLPIEALLKSKVLAVPLLGPSDPADASNVVRLNYADLVAFSTEWNRIANAGHSREHVVLDGDDRLAKAAAHTITADPPMSLSAFVQRERLTVIEEEAFARKLRDELLLRATAMSVLQSICPRAAEIGTAAWRHNAHDTDEQCQALHDTEGLRTLTQYLRDRPPKWLLASKEAAEAEEDGAEGVPKAAAGAGGDESSSSPPLLYKCKMALQATGPQAPMAGRRLLLSTMRPTPPPVEVRCVGDIDLVMQNSVRPPMPYQCDLLPMRWTAGVDERIPSLAEGSAVWELHRCLDEDFAASVGQPHTDDLVRDGDLVKVLNYIPAKPRFADDDEAAVAAEDAEVPYLVPPMVKAEVTVWQIRIVRKEVPQEPIIPVDETPIQRAIRERAEIRSKIVFANTGEARINPADVSAVVVQRRGEVIKLSDEFELVHPVKVDARSVANTSSVGAVVDREPDRLLTFSVDNLHLQKAGNVDKATGKLALHWQERTKSLKSTGGGDAVPATRYNSVIVDFSRWCALPVVLVPSKHTQPAEVVDVKFAVHTVMEEGDKKSHSDGDAAAATASSPKYAEAPVSVFGLDAFAKAEITMTTLRSNDVANDNDSFLLSPNSEGMMTAAFPQGYPQHKVTVTVEGFFVHALPIGKVGSLVDGSSAASSSNAKPHGPHFKLVVENIATITNGPLPMDLTALADDLEARDALLARATTLPMMHNDTTEWRTDFSFGPSTVLQWSGDASERLVGIGGDDDGAVPSNNSNKSATPHMAPIFDSFVSAKLVAAEPTRFAKSTAAATPKYAAEMGIHFTANVPLAHRPSWPQTIDMPLAFTVTLPTDAATAPFSHVWANSDVAVKSSGALTGPNKTVFPWEVLSDVIRVSRPPTAIPRGDAQLSEVDQYTLSELTAQKARLAAELKANDKLVRQLFEQRAKMPNASRAQQAVLQAQIDGLTQETIPKLLVELAAHEGMLADKGHAVGGGRGEAGGGKQLQSASSPLLLVAGGGACADSPLRVSSVVEALHRSGFVSALAANTTNPAAADGAAPAAGDVASEEEGDIADTTAMRIVVDLKTTNSNAPTALHTFTVSAVDTSRADEVLLVKAHPAAIHQTFSI